MNVLLLGAGGLLGRHLHAALEQNDCTVVSLNHEQCDICDSSLPGRLLDDSRPDVVINTAAFCSFDGCELNPDISRRVNLEAPLRWSELCARRGIRLVLFSSDYIFDGGKMRPYLEEDEPSPLSVYGCHKAQLESDLKDVPTNLVLRPAWIFGLGGRTFMSLLPDLLCEKECLEVASGKAGSCLHAADGARGVVQMVLSGQAGLWNFVHRGATSWEEFARECLQEMQRRNLPVKCAKIQPRPFELLSKTTGQRPAYSVLDTTKLDSSPVGGLPTWKEGLNHYLDRWVAERQS